MKTNKLFVCDYCDKILSCEKSVKCHISIKHKADPENPIMFHDILVSPTEVDSLLGKIKSKKLPRKIAAGKEPRISDGSGSIVIQVTGQEATNPRITEDPGIIGAHMTADLCSELRERQAVTESRARQEVTEPRDKQGEPRDKQGEPRDKQGEPRDKQGESRDKQGEHRDRQEVTDPKSWQEVTEPRDRLAVTGPIVGTIKTHKTKVEKRKFSSYNYRKLANQFSLPSPRKEPSPPPQPSNLLDMGIQEEASPSVSHSEKLPERRHFQVPYKRKPPRGKCSNWLSCINCSRDTDCEECKFCLHPYLNQKCVEKQCRFSNKRLFKKFQRDQKASHIEIIQDDSIPELQQPPEISYCLPMPPPAFDNEDDFSAVEEDGKKRGEDGTAEKEDVTAGKEDVTAGQEDVTTGQEDVTTGQEDVTTRHEDVTTGQEDFTTVGVKNVNDIIVDEASTTKSADNRKFKCSKCDKTFRKYGAAKGHCKGKDILKCPICGKVIKHRSNKARHISRCHKKREKSTLNANDTTPKAAQTTTQCRLCNKTYNSPASLRAHISYKHGENRDGHFKCEKCNFVTNLASELKRHTTLKHMEVKFECQQCDYSCSSASGMKKHRLAAHRTQSSSFQNPAGIAVNSQTPEKADSGQGQSPYLHSSTASSLSVITGLDTSISDMQTEHSLVASGSYLMAELRNTTVSSNRHPTDIIDVYADYDQGNICDKPWNERTLSFSDY